MNILLSLLPFSVRQIIGLFSLFFSFLFFLFLRLSFVQMNNLLLHIHTHTLTHEQRILLYYWKGPVITLIAILGCLIIYFSYPHFYLFSLFLFSFFSSLLFSIRTYFTLVNWCSFCFFQSLKRTTNITLFLSPLKYQVNFNFQHKNCLFTLLLSYDFKFFLSLILLVFLLSSSLMPVSLYLQDTSP